MIKHFHGGDIYRYKNVIDFSTNCNPLGTPASVKEAVCAAVERIEHYPDVECEDLKKAIGSHHNISPDWIFCGNGAAEVIFSVVSALKPKKALLMAPTFAEYEQALEAGGCQIDRHELAEATGFRPDDAFIDSVNKTIDMVFLCNPNNPTGVLLEKEYVVRLAEKCRTMGAFLVVDECFIDFVAEPEIHTMVSELAGFDNLLILKAFTKLYAMAGVRLGYGLSANTQLIEKMRRAVQPWNVSVLAQSAGVAALAEKEYVKKSLEIIRESRRMLLDGISAQGYKVYESSSNYIFFRGPEELWEKCLAEGIMLRDCSNYHGLSVGYYRAAVRLKEENDKLLKVLDKYKE